MKRAGHQDLFEEVFQKINLIALLFDQETGKIINVNKRFLKQTGFLKDEVVDKPISSLPLFHDALDNEKISQRLKENRKNNDLHTYFTDQCGKKRVFLFSTTPLVIDDRQVHLITAHDITEEVHQLNFQEALYNRYHSIINKISSAVVLFKVLDDGERFIYLDFNRATEKMGHVKKEDVIGKELREVFPNATKFGFPALFRKVYRTGISSFHPVTYKDREGKQRWRDTFIYKLSGDELLFTYDDQTPQRLYQKEIKESEKRYRELADLLPIVVFETDRDGIIRYANKLAMKVFRYTREDLESGLRLESMVIPEERFKARREIFYQIRNSENKTPIEFTGIRKDGTTFPVSFSVSPIIRDGNLQGLRGILIDLTEQKNIQEQIKRDKTYLESLIQGAPEAIMQTFKDGTILRINKEFTRLFGYTEEEVLGRHVSEVLYGDNEEVKKKGEKMIRRIAQGKPQSAETIRYHKDGTPVPVSLLGSPIILDGRIIGVFVIYRDISERKKNERITETILNISTAALTTHTLSDFFELIREELSHIINTRNLFIALYDKEKDTLNFPLHMDEKDGTETFREVPARKTLSGYVIRHRKPVLMYEDEMIALEEQGEFDKVGTQSKIWLGVPLAVDDEIIGIISIQDYENEKAFTGNDLKILRIISNQIALAIKHKQAQELLRVAKERAEENARFKEQFLSTMSHEIRTPLNAIIGMTRLLAGTDPTPGQIDYIKALEVSGNNLLRLINDILDYSKLEAGKMVIEEIEFNPVEQIEILTSSYRYIAEEKGLQFVVDVDKEIPTRLLGDPTRINQILTNLIGNAIKFTNEGAVTLSLRLIKDDQSQVLLEYSVADTGIGIPEEKLENIFESFSQADKATTRKFGGTGLGLSISRKLAELLNSRIEVSSKVGEGTRFSFVLRMKKIKDAGSRYEKDTLDEIIAVLKGKKVLIAEDNALNRIVAIKSMKDWGMEIDQCENGREAVSMVEKNSYDVILMDLQMPVMDGYEATRAIRHLPDEKKRSIPVIALTASALMDIRSQAAEYKMDDILLKPFKPDDLARMLHRVIVGKRE